MDAYPLDEHDLCLACRESTVNFDAAYSFGSYESSLQKLINVFKYGKVETLAGPLSKLLMQALPLNQPFDHVLAMPMHWRKRCVRGFNQAELLAVPVARRYGLKLSDNLRRTRPTKSQAGLNEAQRRDNLQGSFKVMRPQQLAGKRILLIDDVFTTGATLRCAAASLKAAGAAYVCALTLARVDRRSSGFNSAPKDARDKTRVAGTGVK